MAEANATAGVGLLARRTPLEAPFRLAEVHAQLVAAAGFDQVQASIGVQVGLEGGDEAQRPKRLEAHANVEPALEPGLLDEQSLRTPAMDRQLDVDRTSEQNFHQLEQAERNLRNHELHASVAVHVDELVGRESSLRVKDLVRRAQIPGSAAVQVQQSHVLGVEHASARVRDQEVDPTVPVDILRLEADGPRAANVIRERDQTQRHDPIGFGGERAVSALKKHAQLVAVCGQDVGSAIAVDVARVETRVVEIDLDFALGDQGSGPARNEEVGARTDVQSRHELARRTQDGDLPEPGNDESQPIPEVASRHGEPVEPSLVPGGGDAGDAAEREVASRHGSAREREQREPIAAQQEELASG